jgi:hypothetical protein
MFDSQRINTQRFWLSMAIAQNKSSYAMSFIFCHCNSKLRIHPIFCSPTHCNLFRVLRQDPTHNSQLNRPVSGPTRAPNIRDCVTSLRPNQDQVDFELELHQEVHIWNKLYKCTMLECQYQEGHTLHLTSNRKFLCHIFYFLSASQQIASRQE